MQISISQEDQLVLETLKADLIQIKQTLLEWGVAFLISSKHSVFQFLLSYEEFSLSNIRKHGFINILTDRAIRFFKLEKEYEKAEHKNKTKKQIIKARVKRFFRKVIKLTLFPVYLLIIVLQLIFEKKSNKNKMNSYKT